MRTKTAVSILLIATLGTGSAIAAGSTSAQMTVSVEVVGRTILTIVSQPSSIEVTAADVARGYVVVPNAIGLQVRSNASSGYGVRFEPLPYPFSGAEVNWDNAIATVGNGGTLLTRPYRKGTTEAAIGVRLTLAPGTQPGSYSWPISLAASSL